MRHKTSLLCVLLACAGGSANAVEINGIISAPLTITEDSELVGDVTCTVSGAPCITIGASAVRLKLNGFTMTGLGDSQTGCKGAAVANEFGIFVNAQAEVMIQGPGLVQQFQNTGVLLLNSSSVTVTGVTAATNCASGILVSGGALNELSRNVSIRNGNGVSPCGGI